MELNSGDQIEILTTAANKPNNRWLDYVITARARSKIKTALKEEEKNIAEEGKAILTRKLRHLKIPFVEKTVNELVNYFELKTSLDLFYRIANGAIDNSQLKAFVAQRNNRFMNFFKRGLKKHPQQKSLIKRRLPVSMTILFLETTMRNSMTLLLNGCNPIPGDQVFGFITVNDGIKIHKKSCPNSISLQSNYAYRIIKAKWIDSSKQEFKVILYVSGVDNKGIANNLTRIISNAMNVFIHSINIAGNEGIFEGKLSLSIKNKAQLVKLINRIKKVDGEKIERVNNDVNNLLLKTAFFQNNNLKFVHCEL